VRLALTGILIYSDLQSVSAEDMLECFRVNAMGPLLTSQALLNAGLLGGGRRSIVGNVTSKVTCVVCSVLQLWLPVGLEPGEMTLQPVSSWQDHHQTGRVRPGNYVDAAGSDVIPLALSGGVQC
jgi:hypothetical protein